MDFTGLARNIGPKVEQLLKLFPVTVILGVRQCGKTTLARMMGRDWDYFDLERGMDFDFITRDFEFFFKEHSSRVIIDEAQLSEQLFKEMRSVVDRDRTRKGRFLLTGSSSPFLLGKISETLAGRVGIAELGTLKMNERYGEELPMFYDILCDEKSALRLSALKMLKPCRTYDQVMTHFLSGGYPEPVLSHDAEFHRIWMRNYYDTYIQRDLLRYFPRINVVNFRRFVQMLAELTGTIINRAEVGRSLGVSEMTVRDYLDIAEGTFVWRNIRSFEKSTSKSIVKMPRGYIRDSGLLHYLLKIDSRERLLGFPKTGAAFEAFIIEEIISGLTAKNAEFEHRFFRTRNGAEVDLVLEGAGGIVPIEIKFGLSTDRRQLSALSQFVEREDCAFGILINNAENVAMLTERIIQIPASLI